MARSRIRKVADEFEEALQASIACISTSVLVSRRDEPGKPHRLLLTPPARVASAAGILETRIAHSYSVVLVRFLTAPRVASTANEGRNGTNVSMKAARRCIVAYSTRNSPAGSSNRPLPVYAHGGHAGDWASVRHGTEGTAE